MEPDRLLHIVRVVKEHGEISLLLSPEEICKFPGYREFGSISDGTIKISKTTKAGPAETCLDGIFPFPAAAV